jgi:hypothetical protein
MGFKALTSRTFLDVLLFVLCEAQASIHNLRITRVINKNTGEIIEILNMSILLF